MKILLITLLLFVMYTVSAQTETEKNQSVTLNLLGIQYNYEQPLSKSTTVTFHGGLAGSLGYGFRLSINDNHWALKDTWYYSLRTVLGTDFRYYYNLEKRARKEKNTRKNTANFLAVDLQYYTPAIYTYHMIDSHSIFKISPYWGIRRVYSTNWLFEINLGFDTGIEGGYWGWKPKTDFKIGYSF